MYNISLNIMCHVKYPLVGFGTGISLSLEPHEIPTPQRNAKIIITSYRNAKLLFIDSFILLIP